MEPLFKTQKPLLGGSPTEYLVEIFAGTERASSSDGARARLSRFRLARSSRALSLFSARARSHKVLRTADPQACGPQRWGL